MFDAFVSKQGKVFVLFLILKLVFVLVSAKILPTVLPVRNYVINDEVVSIFAIYWKETASVLAVPFNNPIIFWLFMFNEAFGNVMLFRLTVLAYLPESYVYIAVLMESV